MTRAEQYKKKQSLVTALQRGAEVLAAVDKYERGAEVLAAVDKYERDKNKQGIYILLDHETYRSVVNVCFPEIEQEIIATIKSRYTQLMRMWDQELKNIMGEITK